MLGIIRAARGKQLVRELSPLKALANDISDPEQIDAWQLDSFNNIWRTVQNNVPFYKGLRLGEGVPAQFKSWSEVRERLPVIDKSSIKARGQELWDKTRKPDEFRSTGGSTGEPIHIPIWSKEIIVSRMNLWYGRSWWGIQPNDVLFLLWGHGQLFGNGIRRHVNKSLRAAKDKLNRYVRVSAYDLSRSAMQKAADRLINCRADYMLGFSSALDKFARENKHRSCEFQQLGLKGIIATAENFPRHGSRHLIREVFGAPVIMEYGAVETGPMAYETPDGEYVVFWPSFRMEAIPTSNPIGSYDLLVTCLYQRKMPLIRYKIGDLISKPWPEPELVLKFPLLKGRSHDVVRLGDGSELHFELIDNVIRHFDFVEQYQIKNRFGGNPVLEFISESHVGANQINLITQKLCESDPRLQTIDVRQVNQLQRTISGKFPTTLDS